MPFEARDKLMAEQVEEIYHILTGNGEPKNGLVYKVARVEDHVNFMTRFGWILVTAAVGILTKAFLVLFTIK